MAEITIKNVFKRYGDGFPAVNDVSLDIADGEFMILVGPSGCGKSTLLRMIVGLEDISSGDVIIGGKRVNDKAPRDRNLAMVFQNYALYPHLSVFENIAFPLRLQGKHSNEEIRKLVNDAADTLELQEHLERKPSQLSGGQRQRVAMGRALVRDADAYLFDEPLPNLDAKLRGQMRTEILRLQRRLGVTTVYVTHDQTEAMTLGDGQLFITGIRPGSFEDASRVDPGKAGRGITFDVTVDVTEWLGNEQYAFVPYEAPTDIAAQLAELAHELDSEQMRTQLCVSLDPMSRVPAGGTATLWLDPSRIHLFDPKSGENLTRGSAMASSEPVASSNR